MGASSGVVVSGGILWSASWWGHLGVVASGGI